jgi:hypothetical protein
MVTHGNAAIRQYLGQFDYLIQLPDWVAKAPPINAIDYLHEPDLI